MMDTVGLVTWRGIPWEGQASLFSATYSEPQELLPVRTKRTASHVVLVEHALDNSVRRSFKPPLYFSVATAQNSRCSLFWWSGRVFHYLSVIQTDRKDCACSNVRATPLPVPTPEGLANYKFTMFQKVTYVPQMGRSLRFLPMLRYLSRTRA
jgi:hypothetical protein